MEATPSLTGLVHEAAQAHPDAVAVDSADCGTLCYRELTDAAAELARELSRTDARTVAVTGTRGPGLVTAVLATALAGVRLLTVDPALPAARREAMLRRTGADVTVTAEGRATRLSRLPKAAAGTGSGTGGATASVPRSGYVFFTSGTTARPKAVLGRWESLAHFVRWQRDRFGIGPGDRFAQLTGLSFDVVLRDLFTPLVSGATICVPPEDVAVADGGVAGWLREASVTVVHTVPSLAARWTAPLAPGGEGTTGVRDTALRLTFFAGEPLAEAAVRQWRSHFTGTRVLNLYGPTETTLAKFCHDVTDPAPGVQLVGRPLPETELRLVEGEVWLRTPHGTAGYLDAPDEQRARFVTAPEDGDKGNSDDSPASAVPWYRTGDLGSLTPEGELRLHGRTDLQVKINGNRVEPEGVAAALRELPGVRNAVVVARERADGAVHLAGFYESEPGTAGEETVRAALRAQLPEAQVPSVLRRLGELPLTANGKVDRTALPDPRHEEREQQQPDAGDDQLGAAVLDAFRTVLADGAGSPDADFFDYGGTSLDAADLAVRLLAATGRRIEMSEIYRLRTPRALTAALRTRERDEEAPVPRGEQPPVTGLSPQQRRYRDVYLPRVNRSWSNMPALFPLPEGTTAEQVEGALRTVLARHDSLRAWFTEEEPGGRLTQHFTEADGLPSDDAALRVETTDLRALSGRAQGERLEKLRIAEANSPIDITRWPLFRARVVHHGEGAEEGDARTTLLWNVHHMVSDGHSQQLLRRELTHLLSGGPEQDLPELPISYRDYIGWRARQDESATAAQRAYWRGVFAEPYERPLLPALDSPLRHGGTDGARPARGIAHQFPVPGELREEIDTFCRTHGVTAFSVCFAAYLLMAHRLFDRDDLVVGTPAAGRTRAEHRHLIGNFISLVGIRHRRGEAAAFSELVRLVQERTVLAMEHQDYQYDEVMADIGAERDDDRFPLTTVFISLVDTPEEQSESLRTASHRDLGCDVKFDLMGYLRRSGSALALDLHTRQGLLDEERLERLREDFLAGLRRGLKG